MDNYDAVNPCLGTIKRIADIDHTFKKTIDNFSGIAPFLNKKDVAVKHISGLINEAVTTYSIQQCYFVDAVGMVLETLESAYQLVCCDNTAAQQALVAQSKLARHPLRKTLKSLVKKLHFAEVTNEQ